MKKLRFGARLPRVVGIRTLFFKLIYIYRCLGEPLQLDVKLLPLPVLKLHASFDLLCAQARFRNHHTVGQLLCRHFKREDGDRHVEVHRSIAGHIDHKGGLTDRRTGCKDDKVGRLPAEGDVVHRRKAGRDSAVTGAFLTFLKIVQCVIDDLADLLHILLDIVLDGRIDL